MIFLSENVEEYFINNFNVKSTTRVPHGVQAQKVDLTRNEARDILGWDVEAEIVILPGYIRPQKNHESFLSLAEEDKSRQYVIAGGVRNNKFEQYSEKLRSKSSENVEITGVLNDEEFEAAFIAADLCYLPYQDVSQSGIVNWSLASGLPVFGSEIKYFRELSESTEAVKIVGISPEGVIPEIRSYFDNEKLRTRMSNSAQEFAKNNSMKEVADEHIRIYRSFFD